MILHDDLQAPQKLPRAAELMCMKPRVCKTILLWPCFLHTRAEAHSLYENSQADG